MAWPCSSLSVCSSLKPYCRHSRSILRKRLKLGNHWYALSRFRFRLLTSCWCCSLIRLSSLAWLSFIFCISVRRLSIWSFKFSTSLCSWAFSFSNRLTLLPPRREFTPLSTLVAVFVAEIFSSSVPSERWAQW